MKYTHTEGQAAHQKHSELCQRAETGTAEIDRPDRANKLLLMDTQKTVDVNGGKEPEKEVQNTEGPGRHRGIVCSRTITGSRTLPFVLLKTS